MKNLLHICCAPCSISCIDLLRGENIDTSGFWFNPNIHPWTEYKSRRNALTQYAKMIGLNLEMNDEYGLRPFIHAVYPNLNNRCGTCYDMRLDATARYAAENGYESFSTTLLVSPYQNHELLIQTAEKASARYQVEFLYRDFRPLFREGQQKARELDLYMQKYCGCVFSEEERYLKK